VVGAHSVVKGLLPRNTICVGTPASPRRSRFENDGR
jgi:acetyltransferase-like isoleucine patch superfamily enzyme